MTDLAREKSWCTLISLTCKGSPKQRYTIQSYPVNWHFHSIIPHPKNKTYIRKNHGLPRLQASGGLWRLRKVDTNHRDATWEVTQAQRSFETWCPLFSCAFWFDSVCEVRRGNSENIPDWKNRTSPHFPTDFFRYHSFFPSFHLILCTVPGLYYVPWKKQMRQYFTRIAWPRQPLFWLKTESSTSCLFGGRVGLFFRNFNDDVFWMFLLLCLATKNFFNHTPLRGSPMRTSSQEESSSLGWSLHPLQGSYWSAWWKGGQYIDHIQFIQYI